MIKDTLQVIECSQPHCKKKYNDFNECALHVEEHKSENSSLDEKFKIDLVNFIVSYSQIWCMSHQAAS